MQETTFVAMKTLKKALFAVPLVLLLFLLPNCAKKTFEGFVSYQGEILFPIYDATGRKELNEKVKDATLKIHYARYSTEFGPDELKVVESSGMPPCVYLGDLPLLYADDACARAYGMAPAELARHWIGALADGIFAGRPLSAFPGEMFEAERDLSTPEAALEAAQRDGVPLFVNFYANWCGWCLKMKPHIEAAEDEFSESMIFIYINVEDPAQSEFVKQYKAYDYLPESVFLDPEGGVIRRVGGYVSEKDLFAAIRKIAG
ncbi:MAG: thioredoxin domain-containing protein [bacterium]